MIDPRIDFVFGSVGPQLKQELRDFWSQHGATYRQQLRSFREQLAAPGARVLLADNVNPGLKKAFMRRYFTRLGFRMLGGGHSGGEVWARPLPIRFEF